MPQNQPLSVSSLTLEPSKLHTESSRQSQSDLEYASEEENAEFHRDFPDVPKEEKLAVDVSSYWFWCCYAAVVKEVCSFLHNWATNVDPIQSLEAVQDILHVFDPSKIALLLDLLLAEVKRPDLNQKHTQGCMKLLGLLIKAHNILPPSLVVQDEICTLVNLDPETADAILSALEPSIVSLAFDLLQVEAKSPDLDDEYHQIWMMNITRNA
ncbi:hypothetical protein L218DRAFT_1006637 [Marasmius fiardii PR-910]|nr:hypothetical protein L218DRAFT_1006637 [Marasmius fiardii PR-910]